MAQSTEDRKHSVFEDTSGMGHGEATHTDTLVHQPLGSQTGKKVVPHACCLRWTFQAWSRAWPMATNRGSRSRVCGCGGGAMSRAGTFCFARPLVFASPLCPLPTLCKLIFRISAGLCANLVKFNKRARVHVGHQIQQRHQFTEYVALGHWICRRCFQPFDNEIRKLLQPATQCREPLTFLPSIQRTRRFGTHTHTSPKRFRIPLLKTKC